MDTEPPTIDIHRVYSDKTRIFEERLKKFKDEILPPNEWELEVCKKSTQYLNDYRLKYAHKKPISEDHVKLRIVGDTNDLNDMLEGTKMPSGHSCTGGFVDNNGEFYIAGGWRSDPLEIAHLIVHENTHVFTGKVMVENGIFSSYHMEAATELVAIEILAKIITDFGGFRVIEDDNITTITDEDAILKFLEENYQTYQNEIKALKNPTEKDEKTEGLLLTNNIFDFEEIKKKLFAGNDYVQWGYNEHYDGSTPKKDKLTQRIIEKLTSFSKSSR